MSAAVDPTDPSILLAGSNSLQRDHAVRVYSSTDAGVHWSSGVLPLPTAFPVGAVDQVVAIGPDHRQAMASVAFSQLAQSGEGDDFAGGTLFVATRSGPSASWLVPSTPVDTHLPQGAYDDKPALVADISPTSPFHGRLYVAWTRWVGQNGMILVSHSTDWGQTWSSPLVLWQKSGNWGVALAIAPDGTVVAAWAGSDHLRISRSTDGGGRFSPPAPFGTCVFPGSGCIGDPALIPAQADAGVRANPALVVAPASGGQPAQVLALYAIGDNSDGNSHTHIELARFDEASLHLLGTPAVVPLGPSATDQLLPAAAYDPGQRTLWACAYTSLVKVPSETRYTCTASLDGGETFLPATAAASVVSDETLPAAFRHFIGRQYGDYTAVVVAGGVAHAFWTDSRELNTLGEEIFTATLQLNGAPSGSG